MKKIVKYKLYLILIAVVILAVTALIHPESAEMVARAFALIIGVI